MKPQQAATTAHSLFTLYEILPSDVQQAFLKELLQQQTAGLKDLAVLPKKNKTVILGVMEGAFSVPNNFDDALPEEIEKSFYSENL